MIKSNRGNFFVRMSFFIHSAAGHVIHIPGVLTHFSAQSYPQAGFVG
ncbi:hypothetical protein CSB69_0944 [Morganella morganii]|nr:hypothetical protein CSB69_0944 [Morganella morganii]EMP50877.1 hypothetical protein C790_01901 [Morganella morganii SC01]